MKDEVGIYGFNYKARTSPKRKIKVVVKVEVVCPEVNVRSARAYDTLTLTNLYDAPVPKFNPPY